MQHSYREHLGCGEARRGVVQDEKCEDRSSRDNAPKDFLQELKTSAYLLLLPLPPDVPGYSAGASALHPSQQLCGGPRLDRHPDQSQPVQPQTPEHLPPFSLPQRPLALLQAVCRHSPGVYALHWVHGAFKAHPQSDSTYFPSLPLTVCMCSPNFSGLPANIQLDVDGDRETERIYSLFGTYMTKLIKMQGQTPATLPHALFSTCVHFHFISCFLCDSPMQRPVEVSLCTMGPNRRNILPLSSTTPRRRTKP